MEELDVTIIGSGVIGLAIASEIAGDYNKIVVLEKNSTFGQEISSRNSEVIHSGIYYSEGSLKARLCVEGSQKLYYICQKYSIPHKKIGKLIVATTNSELKPLESLFDKGKRNNAKDLVIFDKFQIKNREPQVKAIAAIYAANTGIIDSHALMKHFFDSAKSREVIFAFSTKVIAIKQEKDGFLIKVQPENYLFKTRVLINCAGLSSDYIASLVGIDVRKSKYELKFCKGSYFYYNQFSPVKILVYPLPESELSGLGIHATLNLTGRLRFGPDVEYVDHIDYTVDESKRNIFYKNVSRLISGIKEDRLVPDQAGIRPKLYGKREKARDFIITQEKNKGLSNLINLIGIESPGLSASPAIAAIVKKTVKSILN